MTAAAYAQLGAMPLLMITSQKPIRQAGQAQFQNMDIVGMIKWKNSHPGFDEFGLDFSSPDFVENAHARGAAGHRLAQGEKL